MEQQLCLFACSALGETGSLIFALVIFVWGLYQRRAKVKTDTKVTDLEAKRLELEAERLKLETEIKVLSLRPPAVPTFVIQAATPVTTPTPPPPPDPHVDDDQPFPDESNS